ncbi:MAG: glycosyltransferase [Rhodobacteraceae bacterium]|jgi:glycosyltransferase involved in cell wall biosynthesis|nr:glycosyltransferase [Paracoccaceae bacterium]
MSPPHLREGSAIRLAVPSGSAPAGAPRPEPPRPAARGRRPPARRALLQILLEEGALAPGDLVRALALQARQEAGMADILLAHGMVDEAALARGLAVHWGTRVVDPLAAPPDPSLIDRLGAETCLRLGILPWRRLGGACVVLAARPEEVPRRRSELEARLGPVRLAVAPMGQIVAAIARARCREMGAAAEARVEAADSCRTWQPAATLRRCLVLAVPAAALLAARPAALFLAAFAWAVVTLAAAMALKAAAAGAALGHRLRRPRPAAGAVPTPLRLPVVSLIVPLFREPEVAGRLVARLARLSYPRELLDVLIVVEAGDGATRQALGGVALPRWMRVVTVPPGRVQTKPRALNYALAWARGGIVGVYDAEDRPDPDQIHAIVRRFHERGPDVACLQGVLDYYNPRVNWLSRCFTIEYAAWFRIVLPGIARLGLAVPLGGTTVFFRRAALEAVGGWDAHNVTEDADLGIRLARRGYRTELVATVTEEEANCRLWPWVRQRSRWIKGYAATWAVHMRDPRRLWRDLGPRAFIGFQVHFLCALSQFLLAPLLWSTALLAAGLPHPLPQGLPGVPLVPLWCLFVAAEMLNLAVALCGLPARHRSLAPWALTLPAYYVLATIAAWKAIADLLLRPFHWDKTAHGLFDTPAGCPG